MHLPVPRIPGRRGGFQDIPVVGKKKVLLAAPRGYCAGVDRAVIAVEKALERYGAPVYVRKQIVHNIHVVTELEKKGAVFVEEVDEVPTSWRPVRLQRPRCVARRRVGGIPIGDSGRSTPRARS